MAYTQIRISEDGTAYAPTADVARAMRINIEAAIAFAGPHVTEQGIKALLDRFQPHLSKRERTKLAWIAQDFSNAGAPTHDHHNPQ